jgi:GTP pyrophosphokinase
MPRRHGPSVSNSAADRAGETIRRYLRGEATQLEAARAVVVIANYREMHAYPMTKVTVGVRSMIQTATRDDGLRPGQRFKRMNRIVGKLERFPHMRLSQMEDIGGCRAVLPDLETVYQVLGRVRKNWGHRAKVLDYVENPKADGYRGIHVIERRDGRYVEVQLRTEGQHTWAEAVEAWGPRLGFNLKDGQGPDDLRQYYRMAGERIARAEAGLPIEDEFEAQFVTLRERVTPYFTNRTS